MECLQHFPYSPVHQQQVIKDLSAWGTPGETVALSFSLESQEPLTGIEISVSDLTGKTGKIPTSQIELYCVKVWQQAGVGVYQSEPFSVGELLLKDDSVSLEDGYNGTFYTPPKVRLTGNPIISLESKFPKQIFLSLVIPQTAPPGWYQGRVRMETADKSSECELAITLEVLPFQLAAAEHILSIWYKGTLDPNRPQHYVTPETMRYQLQDIWDHGFRSISLNEFDHVLAQQAVDIAESIGFDQYVVYYPWYPADADKLRYRSLTPLYYVSDEIDAYGNQFIEYHIHNFRRAKAFGGLTLASLIDESFAKRFWDPNDIGHPPDLLSYSMPASKKYFFFAAQFPELRKQDAYYYWLTHMEKPNVHRVMAGFYLWKSQAKGIFPYAYQHLPRQPFSPFNDFDEWEPDFHLNNILKPFKDHMTTYPAQNGVIPTLQWEGLREGITDLRYLTTLENILLKAQTTSLPEIATLVSEIRLRSAEFMKRIHLRDIQITSETLTEPYPAITPEEYHRFRRQIAMDILSLQNQLGPSQLHA